MYFYPTSSFAKLHMLYIVLSVTHIWIFKRFNHLYMRDNLTFNDNLLCKVWRKFVCTTYQENWIIPPRKHVNKNVQKKLLYSFDDSFRWANKKFRVMSPLKWSVEFQFSNMRANACCPFGKRMALRVQFANF
jgi:hypothetical protein